MPISPLLRTEPTVVVVQGDEWLTREIEKALDALHCTMTHFRDGPPLLDAIDAGKMAGLMQSMLIVDFRLPSISGIRLLQELARRRRAVPAIVTTAWVDDGICELLRGLGARHVLFKPIGPKLLRASISETQRFVWTGVTHDSSVPPASPRQHTT